jgi:hypothetical protein
MNSIEYLQSLSPEAKAEEMKAAKRAFVKYILTITALKVGIAVAITVVAKKAAKLN